MDLAKIIDDELIRLEKDISRSKEFGIHIPLKEIPSAEPDANNNIPILKIDSDRYTPHLEKLERIVSTIELDPGKIRLRAKVEKDREFIKDKLDERYNVSQRVVDAFMGAYNIILAGFSSSVSSEISMSYIVAGAAFVWGVTREKGRTITISRMIGIGAMNYSVVYPLYLLEKYYSVVSKNDIAYLHDISKMGALLTIPAISIAIPYIAKKIRQSRSEKREDRLSEVEGYVLNLRDRLNRFYTVLDHVENVQKWDGVCNNDLNEFEAACVNHLVGKGSKKKIGYALKRISSTIQKRRDTADKNQHIIKEANVSAVVHKPREMKTRIEEGESIKYWQYTHGIVMGLGLGMELADRISRSVEPSQMDRVIGAILGAVPEKDAVNLFMSNPGLFFLRNSHLNEYLNMLYGVIGKSKAKFGEGNLPKRYMVDKNPVSFSTIDGLKRLEQDIEKKDRPIGTIDYSNIRGYKHMEVVYAMLTGGFRLGSSKPRIGMQYGFIGHIRKSTQNKIGAYEMKHFDDMLGRLIRDRVVLEDKDYKSGDGGRFGGCYSVNPHLDQIKNPQLREFVASLMYNGR